MKAVRSLLLMFVVVTLGGCWWGPGPGYDHGGGGYGHVGYDREGGPGRDR